MKYEMIFGDDDFSGQSNELAEVKIWHDCLGPKFVSLEELHCMNSGGGLPSGTVVLAMRRIIKEPKRWTREDKKAGRLPDVGVSVVGITSHNEKFVVYVDDDVVVVKHKQDQDIVVVFNHSSFLTDHNPIETPAEKAQREEDEFVESLKSVEIHDGTVSSFFSQGARAAYRKLKGGER